MPPSANPRNTLVQLFEYESSSTKMPFDICVGCPVDEKICCAPDRKPNAETNPTDPSAQVTEALPAKLTDAWLPEKLTFCTTTAASARPPKPITDAAMTNTFVVLVRIFDPPESGGVPEMGVLRPPHSKGTRWRTRHA